MSFISLHAKTSHLEKCLQLCVHYFSSHDITLERQSAVSKYFQSEDKKMKLAWNLDGCMVALEQAIKQDYFPQGTRETLQVFLNRQVIDVESNMILPLN